MITTITEDTPLFSKLLLSFYSELEDVLFSMPTSIITIIKQQADSVEVRHYIRSVNSSWKIYLEY